LPAILKKGEEFAGIIENFSGIRHEDHEPNELGKWLGTRSRSAFLNCREIAKSLGKEPISPDMPALVTNGLHHHKRAYWY
jgi:hypothetical protein